MIAALRAEEANLLHARSLALSGGRSPQSKGETIWPDAVISAMQGLQTLYNHTGRLAEWKRLVEQIVPEFAGPDDLPLPGREAQWRLVAGYLVRLAMESRDWTEAERMQRVCVEWDRRNAAPLLARPAETLTAGDKNTLRLLAVSMENLGQVQREVGNVECVQTLKTAITICKLIGDKTEEAVVSSALGGAYILLPTLRDLDEAEHWFRLSLELHDEEDRLGKGNCMAQLGYVAWERFNDAKKADDAQEKLLRHFSDVVYFYQQAATLLPPDRVDALAVVYNQLGNIYKEIGDLERALYHYNQDIHYDELAGNQFGAGQARYNIAILLAENGRLSDALLYARAALRNYEAYGGRAKDKEDKAKWLIAEIEKAINGQLSAFSE